MVCMGLGEKHEKKKLPREGCTVCRVGGLKMLFLRVWRDGSAVKASSPKNPG